LDQILQVAGRWICFEVHDSVDDLFDLTLESPYHRQVRCGEWRRLQFFESLPTSIRVLESSFLPPSTRSWFYGHDFGIGWVRPGGRFTDQCFDEGDHGGLSTTHGTVQVQNFVESHIHGFRKGQAHFAEWLYVILALHACIRRGGDIALAAPL